MSEQFDFILGLDIIEHLEDDMVFLKEMWRLLRPGGWLLLATQNSLSLEYMVGWVSRTLRGQRWVGWDSTHLRFYNYLQLRRKLQRSRFSIMRFNGTYFIPFHFPGRLAGKIVELLGGKAWAGRVQRLVETPFFWMNKFFERHSEQCPLKYLGFGIIVLARKPSED